MNMNDSIDYFAQKVQQDAQLMSASTFHAIGLSQGNNIVRGYIAKYNSILPSIHTFISINGVNAGIGAVPHCIPEQIIQHSKPPANNIVMTSSSSSVPVDQPSLVSLDVAMTLCDLLMEQASAAAYTTFAQKHSFQANYWRDPRPSVYDTYRTYSQLAVLNNEVINPSQQFNETLRVNWSRTSKFVWIMAQNDRTVWPPLGEQWGAPDPQNPYRHIFNMTETDWYRYDYFGLRTAQEQNKNYFESFPGDHLQFTKEDLQRWVETYLM
jgi:palmitoyl-protein thioesterase